MSDGLVKAVMAEQTQSATNAAELAEAVGRVEREMIRLALGDSGGDQGDLSSLVRHPTAPRPRPNRSAIAIPFEPPPNAPSLIAR